MSRSSNHYRPGVYTVDLRKPDGDVLSLTHRADSDLDAHDRALERAINDAASYSLLALNSVGGRLVLPFT